MSFLEYGLFKYGKTVQQLMNAPQGSNKAEMDKAQGMVDAAQAALDDMLAKLNQQREVEAPFKKADEENKTALAELQAQEKAYTDKIETLERKSQEGGVVSRNKALAELEALKSQDPLPLSRAKINQAAAVKKAEKARAPFLEATLKVEAAVAECEARFKEALAFLDEVKAKGGSPNGTIWWMQREIEEKKKFLPQKRH
ncbi:TolA protein [Pelomyxa schiedti]|nr:TolA protein [Pelomyxa schiedti]